MRDVVVGVACALDGRMGRLEREWIVAWMMVGHGGNCFPVRVRAVLDLAERSLGIVSFGLDSSNYRAIVEDQRGQRDEMRSQVYAMEKSMWSE